LITPNARAWREDEVDKWVADRPTARKFETGTGEAAERRRQP
jgi:hypothetical protein